MRSMQYLLQYLVELRPDFIFLCAGDMAKGAHVFGLDRGHRRLGLMMIEIKVSPIPRGCEALRVLDGHISTVERPREVPSS
jgi:hypothetical protein